MYVRSSGLSELAELGADLGELQELSAMARFISSARFKGMVRAKAPELTRLELQGLGELMELADYINSPDFQNLSALEQLEFFSFIKKAFKKVVGVVKKVVKPVFKVAKKVVKGAISIAAPIVGGIVGGPMGAAVGSAAAGAVAGQPQAQAVQAAAQPYQPPQYPPGTAVCRAPVTGTVPVAPGSLPQYVPPQQLVAPAYAEAGMFPAAGEGFMKYMPYMAMAGMAFLLLTSKRE